VTDKGADGWDCLPKIFSGGCEGVAESVGRHLGQPRAGLPSYVLCLPASGGGIPASQAANGNNASGIHTYRICFTIRLGIYLTDGLQPNTRSPKAPPAPSRAVRPFACSCSGGLCLRGIPPNRRSGRTGRCIGKGRAFSQAVATRWRFGPRYDLGFLCVYDLTH
jgi:hypothetical protein